VSAERPIARIILLAAAQALLALLAASPVPLLAQTGTAPGLSPSERQLGFAESLYQEGERFRAESELLRFVHDYPADPLRGAAELARAKLYYQEGRYREASLMLHSWLDRFPRNPEAPSARRLLLLSEVRSGNLAGAEDLLGRMRGSEKERASLAELRESPPNAVDPGAAVAWSTVLPGSGYFLLGQPGKAATAMSLNLGFLAGAVIAYQQHNTGAALALALVGIALYGGQREAVRKDAEALLAARDRERRREWALDRGESELLAVGIELRFGGR